MDKIREISGPVHTPQLRDLNNVFLPYQMQYSSKANILNFTYLEWQVLHIFGGAAMEAELNVIQTQKALLSFSHSYILSAEIKRKQDLHHSQCSAIGRGKKKDDLFTLVTQKSQVNLLNPLLVRGSK